MKLRGKTVLITGAARRLGRVMALAAAREGAKIIVHHAHSPEAAQQVVEEIRALGAQAWALQSDLSKPEMAGALIEQAWNLTPFEILINNAAIFEDLDLWQTDLNAWQRHLDLNLTAPFLLSKAFAAKLAPQSEGRIINILDWRALRPAADHFPYTISKAALAALTRSLAIALAPHIVVNGIALGAILPPSTGGDESEILRLVPARRWANLEELEQLLIFLLTAPTYITGEIIHLDGGRHLI